MAEQNIVIFGAGKIGRSFIGPLFGLAGHGVIFVDMDAQLVEALNARNSYPVIIKGHDREERMIIKNVRAIHGLKNDEVSEAIYRASLLAISVGRAALPAVAGSITRGLLKREKKVPGSTLDIILAENMRSAAAFFRDELKKHLPPTYPIDQRVGLVETSIGKMVPLMTARDLEDDPLQLFAEPYNTLILDKKGFLGVIPTIKELELKDNMKAWVDRKAFIHNLGHATLAYYGHLKMPNARYLWEAMADREVVDFTRTVMLEAANTLMLKHREEFTTDEMKDHIEDLLQRFSNKNLGDTIFRVGHDLARKLSRDDRFMGIIRMAEEVGSPDSSILKAMAMGFRFRGKDENGNMFPADERFLAEFESSPYGLLSRVCGLDQESDARIIKNIPLP